jgi:hypothetical protein
LEIGNSSQVQSACLKCKHCQIAQIPWKTKQGLALGAAHMVESPDLRVRNAGEPCCPCGFFEVGGFNALIPVFKTFNQHMGTFLLVPFTMGKTFGAWFFM